MNSRTTKLKQDIKNAKDRIADLFVDHCKNGMQSKGLGDGVLACGQFFGNDAKNLRQRGVHGIAAAINTLAKIKNTSSTEVISGLARYLENRKDIEKTISKGTSSVELKCERDYENVIKVSEVILALSRIAYAGVNNDGIINTLSKRLQVGMIGQKGWDYFLDHTGDIELLPTAFGMLAMSATGFHDEAAKAATYLKSQLESRYIKKTPCQTANADISMDIFCLYALALTNKDMVPLKNIFQEIWLIMRPLIDKDNEQNIEYLYEDQHGCYIRVPWQLYMISLAGIYGFRLKFSSLYIQNILTDILNRVLNGGFRYPNSGKMLSVRTNAILFEVLSNIEDILQHRSLSWMGSAFDQVKRILYSSFCRWSVRAIMALVAVVLMFDWYVSENTRLSEFAPELFGMIWGAIFSFTFIKK